MAYLKELKISGFKGFSTQNIISFSFPTTENNYGLNIIVGANNSGKSTIFDAIKKLDTNATFPKQERTNTNGITHDTEISISDSDDRTTVIKNIGATPSRINPESIRISDIEWINCLRKWDTEFRYDINSNLHELTGKAPTPFQDDDRDSLRELMVYISKNNELNRIYEAVLGSMIPDFKSWKIDSDDDKTYYLEYCTPNAIHKLKLCGDGIINVFRLIAVLITTDKNVILLDEPEMSLHPQLQLHVFKFLLKLSKTKQIICATHSPIFITWDLLENGGQIIRTANKEDVRCRSYSFTSNSASFAKLSVLKDDYQKPFLLDEVAKKIFFTENVLFLEGQEDYSLISEFIKNQNMKVNFELFGYGCGGSDNVKYFLKFAKEIGVNASVIFDKGTDAIQTCKAIYPEFLIKELITYDIRDKSPTSNASQEGKKGLFDRKGKIKSEHIDYLRNMINEIVEHFNFKY